SRILSLSEDLPVAVVIVDEAEKIQAFLPRLEGLVTAGLAIVDDVTVVHAFGKRHNGGQTDRAGRGTESLPCCSSCSGAASALRCATRPTGRCRPAPVAH